MNKVVSFAARARERATAESAHLLAERLALAAPVRDRLVADARAHVRSGRSAASAIRIARRTARREAATGPERA